MPKIITQKDIQAKVDAARERIQNTKHEMLQEQLKQYQQVATLTNFATLRFRPAPATDQVNSFMSGYLPLSKLPEESRRAHGRKIFDIALNFVRICHVKNVFAADLLESVVVNSDTLDVQFCPMRTRSRFDSHQLQILADFLFCPLQQLFPTSQTQMSSQTELQESIVVTDRITPELLVNKPNSHFYCNGLVKDDQLLHGATSETLWLILARFVNQLKPIDPSKLPAEMQRVLQEFVKYENPQKLPESFMNQISSQKPLEMLRICMGVYPESVEFQKLEIQDQIQDLEVWKQQKVQAIAFVSKTVVQAEETVLGFESKVNFAKM